MEIVLFDIKTNLVVLKSCNFFFFAGIFTLFGTFCKSPALPLKAYAHDGFLFFRKWRVRTRAGPWTAWCFIMTSRVSLKMTSLSPQLKGSMCMDCILTEPGGIAEAANLWNPLKRFSSQPCQSFISTLLTRPLAEMPGCTSARYTRNQGEQIWRILQVWTWKPIRIQITGFCAVSPCCVTLSKFLHITQGLSKRKFFPRNCCKHG